LGGGHLNHCAIAAPKHFLCLTKCHNNILDIFGLTRAPLPLKKTYRETMIYFMATQDMKPRVKQLAISQIGDAPPKY